MRRPAAASTQPEAHTMHRPLPEILTASRLEALYEEFAAKTTGQHSQDLQLLVNWLRGEPMTGKLALLCTVPHREWTLIRMNGRGLPVTRLDEVYHDIDEAERAIFRLRIKMRVGYEIRGD
jgi:hypothetical protein